MLRIRGPLSVARWALAALGASLLAHPVAAQGFPGKPIRILVGFPAGGGVDPIARIVGEELSRSLGQPVVVENKPGAAGMLAAAEVAKSDPDGHVLYVAPGGHAIYGAIFKQLSFDTVESFTWISNVTTTPFYFITHDDRPFKSLADVVSAAKAAPATITYGSAGQGTTHHLLTELMAQQAGIKLVHVPYRGDAAVVTDVLGKHVQFGPATPTNLSGNLAPGKLRALAVTTPRRWPAQPDVPTVAEAIGIKDYGVGSWFGYAGPARMPPATQARLNAEIHKAIAKDDVRKRLEALGSIVDPSTPEALKAKVARELAQWTRIVDSAGIPKQ